MEQEETYFAQFGEDKLLSKIFRDKVSGICVEVGANDGVSDSNTYYFEKIGWKCILVEPNPELCQNIRKVRRSMLHECAASDRFGSATLHVAEGSERAHGVSAIGESAASIERIRSYGFTSKPIEVATRTLDFILNASLPNGPIDFISIDIEGHEYEALKGFSTERWTPTIILVEDNSYYQDNTVSHHLRQNGYVRFMRTGVNDWYAHKSNHKLASWPSRIRYHSAAIIFKAKVKLLRPAVASAKRLLAATVHHF